MNVSCITIETKYEMRNEKRCSAKNLIKEHGRFDVVLKMNVKGTKLNKL